jgi:hypothetical protein
VIHNITLAQFPAVLRALVPQMKDAGVRALRSTGHICHGMTVQEIDNAHPFPAVDRGELRNSVVVDPVSDGAIVHVDAPHAVYIELGT